MLNARISIPQMVSQAGDDARVYPWFAFFWADVHSIATSQPVTVYVTPGFSRDNYPEHVAPGLPVWFPPAATHSVTLDDAGTGTAMVGVLVILIRQHETPDDAIAAGYRAFPDAVSRALNDFVTRNPFTVPSDAQIQTMADAIDRDVESAIKDALSWYDYALPQDGRIGYTHAVFLGGPGSPHPITTLGRRDLALPRAASFTFPTATLDVEVFAPDHCTAQEKALYDAITALNLLTGEIAELQHQLATGTLAEKAVARQELSDLRKNDLPPARQAVASAQAALAQCRRAGSAQGPAS